MFRTQLVLLVHLSTRSLFLKNTCFWFIIFVSLQRKIINTYTTKNQDEEITAYHSNVGLLFGTALFVIHRREGLVFGFTG